MLFNVIVLCVCCPGFDPTHAQINVSLKEYKGLGGPLMSLAARQDNRIKYLAELSPTEQKRYADCLWAVQEHATNQLQAKTQTGPAGLSALAILQSSVSDDSDDEPDDGKLVFAPSAAAMVQRKKSSTTTTPAESRVTSARTQEKESLTATGWSARHRAEAAVAAAALVATAGAVAVVSGAADDVPVIVTSAAAEDAAAPIAVGGAGDSTFQGDADPVSLSLDTDQDRLDMNAGLPPSELHQALTMAMTSPMAAMPVRPHNQDAFNEVLAIMMKAQPDTSKRVHNGMATLASPTGQAKFTLRELRQRDDPLPR